MKENSFTAPTELTIEHHAIMFALLAKYADKECAQKGLDAIGAAVSEYGRERGGRMAKRVLKDGLPLNMQNYLVYGEWTSKPGQMDTRIVQKSPVQITNIHLCEWCTSWKKHNLEKYGSYYCDFVDINLVKGFNPQNDLQIDQVLSKNAPYCIFHWLGYNATPENEAVFAATKKAIGSSCIRDFNYHTAHLYFTMSRVLRNILPKQGDKIVEAALEEFTSKFGEAATNAVLALKDVDFNEI